MSPQTLAEAPVTVGPMLREWRELRRISQLELALRADSSARHLSFVETGRARPSQAMVIRLAEHLDVPMRQRNALLMAAGYAPVYTETPLEAPEMTLVRDGIEKLISAYDPNPALVIDSSYTVLMLNAGTWAMFEGIASHLLQEPINLMRLSLHPEGLGRRVVGFPAWRMHLLGSMERKLAIWPNELLQAVYDEVKTYPEHEGIVDGASEVELPPLGSPLVAPLRLEFRGQLLSFITASATFNTPLDITVSELAIETFMPGDAFTARALADMRKLQNPQR